MKLSLTAATLLATTLTFQGCGGDDTPKTVASIPAPLATPDTEEEPSIADTSSVFFESLGVDSSVTSIGTSIYNWFTNDGEEEEATATLTSTLSALVLGSANVEDFTKQGLKISVEYVVENYTPSWTQDWLLDKDWGDNDDQFLYESLYDSSSTLVGYFSGFYSDTLSFSSAPARSTELEDQQSAWIDKIIDEIYTIIQELIASYFSSTPDVVVIPVDDNSPKIDPNQTFVFEESDINGDVYYVASQQYMTVSFEADGMSGYGDIGYGVGASFSSYISAGELFIDMNGVYEVAMLYKDPNYCIATEMTDTSDGTKYPAYWFSDEAIYDEASNVSTAESLCYIHSTEYQPQVIAEDGVLEAILEERSGHSPVTGSTVEKVSSLVNGVDNLATVTDSKYFARNMRHGVFSIYTTNGQTHTLQATETEKINRELLPLVASSAMNMEELMSSAYDSSVAFQNEVNSALDKPVTELNARFDALITATSQAMDRTVSPNYHGISDVTAYGDVVDFEATNKDISIFRNEAKSDVVIKIYNNKSNGVEADVKFVTKVTTTVIGTAPVEFSDIDATSSTSYISGTDYKLNINNFNYHRANGVMTINGDGYLGNSSRLTFNDYTILANFVEKPTIELKKFSATMDGKITTASGRVFDGKLVFDGDNTENSKMDGTLVGVNSEPKIVGLIQTSLSSEAITEWVATHDSVSTSDAGDLNNIGDQSYSMAVKITKDDKIVSADMLVKRDTKVDTWTYIMQDLVVSDVNGNMSADSIYLIQKGNNTLVATLEKIALNGLNVDSDINTLVNVGWDIASDFDEIGVENLQITMKTDPSDSSKNANVASSVHVMNNGTTMNADMISSYDYGTTHLNSLGNFTTVVDTSSGKNVYDNTFTTSGSIISDNVFNYLYEISYTNAAQYMLFTKKDSSYQMGFVMSAAGIEGGDSYGVVSEFKMNSTYDVLEVMKLRNNDNNPLGIYNRSEDALKIEFADGVKEYMYLY